MQTINIYTACKQGRCRSGNDETGYVVHALKIPKNKAEALCGTKPKPKSNGWIGSAEKKVTCINCLSKISKIEKKIEYVYPNDIDVGF